MLPEGMDASNIVEWNIIVMHHFFVPGVGGNPEDVS